MAEATAFAEDNWQLGKSFMDCASHLYMNEHLSDVTFLLTSETPTRRVPAHKFILAMRSPVFEAMFYGPVAETKTEITMADTSVNGFLLMLRFLYTDWAEVTPDDAMELLQVAHMYHIPKCLLYCVTVLEQSCDVSNVHSLLEVSVFYNLPDLKAVCMKFIETNAAAVINDTGFLSAPLSIVQLIVESSQLQSDELVIYQAMNNWATHQCKRGNVASTHNNKRKYLGDAFSQLRLEHIPLKVFISKIVTESLLSKEEKLDVYNFHNEVIPHLVFVNNNKRCQSQGSTTEERDALAKLSREHSRERSWLLHDCITECAITDIIVYENISLCGANISNPDVVACSLYFQAHAQCIRLYDRVSREETWHRVTGSKVITNGTCVEVKWENIALSKNHEYQLFIFVCGFRKCAQKAASDAAISSPTTQDSDTTVASVTPDGSPLGTDQSVTRPSLGCLCIQNVLIIPNGSTDIKLIPAATCN